jgi:NAD(P)-dependent dehydrogenase (short-subunit alcohol dehydrogenase family)
MAYFVVTEGLRERLLASSPARIVNTASTAHQGATLDFDDLQSAKGFGAMKAYGRSKLCNILFTRELARRLHGTGVTANCLHPGFVATRFGDQSGGVISRFVGLAKLFAISEREVLMLHDDVVGSRGPVWGAALNDYRPLSQKASLARFRASLSWRRGPQPSQTSCTRPAPAHCQSCESAR